MASSATEEQVTLKILVDEEKNRVLFAQAGKDFVEALLSFLTLPLGTIAKKVSIGSLSSLYESIANLEVKHFWTETCKEMLLNPRSSIGAYCQNMKLKIDDTEIIKYFICENWDCTREKSGGALLTTFKNQKCKCGKLMNREISPEEEGVIKVYNEGLIPDMATFIISDDLKVMPDNFQTTVSLLMSFGFEDFDVENKLVTVHVTQKETVDLLQCSLFSKTPLTDFFLRNKQLSDRGALVFNMGDPEAIRGRDMTKLRLMLIKSNSKILFALAEEDFVDFLFSFLTFPLGGVDQMLKGNSCFRSICNLHKSAVDMDGYKYLCYGDLREKLVNPCLARQFKLKNQVLPIDELSNSEYSCYSMFDSKKMIIGYLDHGHFDYSKNDKSIKKEVRSPLSYLEPQSSTGDIYASRRGGRGFVKSASLYMVTDGLVVTPCSSISVLSFLKKSGISPSDVEERVIGIGKKEGLSLLKASLISSSPLTDVLSQLIKPIKEESDH